MMNISPWLVTLVVLGLSGGAFPAWAGSVLEPPTAVSMVDVVQADPHSADHLNRLARHIQDQMHAAHAAESRATFDPRDIPLFADILDEEGNLALPLGLTIYNTMGDTSIGFGSKF